MKKILLFVVSILAISCKKETVTIEVPISPIEQIIYEGDSITDTIGGSKFNWPRQIVNMSKQIAAAKQINISQARDRIQFILTQYNTQVYPFKPLKANSNSIFILMAGINDAKKGRTSTQIYNDIKTEWAMARADGFKIVAMCITRSTDQGRDTASIAVNKLIKSNPSLYDYLVKTDEILPDPADSTNFLIDGLHPNELGSKKIAQGVLNALGIKKDI